MTDRYRSPDDLVLPFIFIPHGAPKSPKVAAFKARHPGWFTIPATFVPRAAGSVRDNAGPLPDGSAATGHSRAASQAAPPRMPERTDTASAFRAFQRANALHGDPVAALRALRDTPDKFAGGAQALPIAQSFALPWFMPPPLGGVGGDIDEAARELSNAITRIFRNENQGGEPPQAQPDAPGDKHASTPTGQRGDPVTVPNGTNRPTVIGGRLCSGHALNQMQGRGVPPSAVEEAIANGQTSPGNQPGTTAHAGKNGVFVVTGSRRQVTSVIDK